MGEQFRANSLRPPVYRITLAQLIVVILLAGPLWFVWPWLAAGVMAGALIEIVSRAYFGFYAFRHVGARQMPQAVRSMKQGAVGKLVLVAVLFGVVFYLDAAIEPEGVFVGYLSAWLLGVLFSNRLIR